MTKINSVYLDLRNECGRIIDSIRVEVCKQTEVKLNNLRIRNGLTSSIMRDTNCYTTYNKNTFKALKKFEVDYLYGTKK